MNLCMDDSKLEEEVFPVVRVRWLLEQNIRRLLPVVSCPTDFKEKIQGRPVKSRVFVAANVENQLVSVCGLERKGVEVRKQRQFDY